MRARELVQGPLGFRAHPAFGATRLGCLGTLILALAGSEVGDTPARGQAAWWFSFGLFTWAGHQVMDVVFYLGMALLVYAWWQLGRLARAGELTVKTVVWVLALWSVPLILGPPLFSLDIYSYAAQGDITRLGLDPYLRGPNALGPGAVLSSVSKVWVNTPAPYGPVFLVAARAVMSVVGSSLIWATIMFRLMAAAGVGLIVWFLPRLARALGQDAGMALWLAVLSPVAMFSFIASGHNDALMVGLLVAGVTLALERRPLAGMALCVLASAVKLPAAAGIVFIAVAWAREVHGVSRWERLAKSAGVVAGGMVAVTYASGLGWGWLGPSVVLGVPTKITLAGVPSDAIGRLIALIANFLGLGVPTGAMISIVQAGGIILVGALGAALLAKTRSATVTASLGVLLAALTLAGPVLWPWYVTWGLVLLAATRAQRSNLVALAAAVAGVALVLPAGSSVLSGPTYVGVALVSILLMTWFARRGRWKSPLSFAST